MIYPKLAGFLPLWTPTLLGSRIAWTQSGGYPRHFCQLIPLQASIAKPKCRPRPTPADDRPKLILASWRFGTKNVATACMDGKTSGHVQFSLSSLATEFEWMHTTGCDHPTVLRQCMTNISGNRTERTTLMAISQVQPNYPAVLQLRRSSQGTGLATAGSKFCGWVSK